MAKSFLIVICAFCYIINRTISAPIIKASGVQWSEPKGTGKGNITLIMIPQNNSCGNDSEMIVAVKSDYQIMSQDTQLLNLVVNENTNNKTNTSKLDASLQKCSSAKEDSANKQEREILKHPNTAKYFEPENKMSSENSTNNTVNIYPLLVNNYQHLISLNDALTTVSYNTVNIFQLLNVSSSNNTNDSVNSLKVSNDSDLNIATRKYNNLNLTEPNNLSVIPDKAVKSKSDDISMVGSDDNFLNEAFYILEKLKQDPSYYNKFKSNQIPSTEERKEHGDISLTDSKSTFFKSDDSILESYEGEGLGREFGQKNHLNQDISNLEGNVPENIPTSTCLPFFMSLNSGQTTTQLIDINIPKEISFEKVPLKGIGSNVSQELTLLGSISSSDENSSFSSKCKPNNAFEETSPTTATPVESYINVSVGRGVQSNDSSQTLSIQNCKLSNVLYTGFTNITPLTTATSLVVTIPSKGEPNYLAQTLAAAKIAAVSEFPVTDSSNNLSSIANVLVSYGNLSQTRTDCLTSNKSGAILAPPNLEQAMKAPSAGVLKPPTVSENQAVNISQPFPVTKPTDKVDQNLLPKPAVALDGSISQNVPQQNELEIKTTECISNPLSQMTYSIVVTAMSTINAANIANGVLEKQTECATYPNATMKNELGLPQAGVEAIPKKITLEPQVSCGTFKKEESCTFSNIESQDAFLRDKDLTLPLVKSSIFLANNNEMPKGKDIPISLNASLDEFSLSDLQEKEDRMHGKVAELYNRNPILFNVEHEPTNTVLKPKRKYYKNKIKSPNFYFDKIYNPESNKILRMNLAGKNLILEERPSYKSETNSRICNNSIENNDKLMQYETEPVGNDNINVKPESLEITTPQIIVSTKLNIYGGDEQKYLDTTIKLLESLQAGNEEEKLLTLLNTDKTTFGTKLQEKFNPLDISTIPSNNYLMSIPIPDNDKKVLSPQESGQNNKNNGTSSEQQDIENMNSKIDNQINWTTKQPSLTQKNFPIPTGKSTKRICSKPYKVKTNNMKTAPDFFRTSSSEETAPKKKKLNSEKMSIPADSLQKIVIEIVRNTKKPKSNLSSGIVKTENERGDQSIKEQREKIAYKEIKNMKQNFVPFQSAWKPVLTERKQTVSPLSDSLQSNCDFSNENNVESLKTEVYEPDGIQEKYSQSQNNNVFVQNRDILKQEQIPTLEKNYIDPFQQTATHSEKSLGANILKLLMADKSVVKNE